MIHEMVFDPAELRTLGAIFDETLNAFTTDLPAVALDPYNSGWRRCCFIWPGTISSAKTRLKPPPFAY